MDLYEGRGPSRWYTGVSRFFFVGALFFLIAAVLHFTVGSGPLRFFFPTIEGEPQFKKVLFFVVDRSGSMGESLADGSTKMQLVRKAVQRYVDKNGRDELFGLIGFARAADVEVPLCDDRNFFNTKLTELRPERIERLNGTAIGYAIIKTIYLILACQEFSGKEMRNSMIVITDGIEEPHPADRMDPFRSIRSEDALKKAAEEEVSVHYINIDPRAYGRMRLEERGRLRALVERTGGIYAEVSEGRPLEGILKQIAKQEEPKAHYPTPQVIGVYILILALFFCTVSRLLESFFLRVVP